MRERKPDSRRHFNAVDGPQQEKSPSIRDCGLDDSGAESLILSQMQDGQFQKIQSWFEHLNGKIDGLDLKFENRFNMLMTALTNLDKGMEQEIKQLKEEIHT